MLPYHLHQKLRRAQQIGTTSSSSLSVLKGLPFWIWDKEAHREEYIRTNGQCCANHILGLPIYSNELDGKSIFIISGTREEFANYVKKKKNS